MTHGDDPWPGCSVLIGFLERRTSVRGGNRRGGEAGPRGDRDLHPVTWRSLSNQ